MTTPPSEPERRDPLEPDLPDPAPEREDPDRQGDAPTPPGPPKPEQPPGPSGDGAPTEIATEEPTG